MQKLSHFIIQKKQDIKEINATLIELKHEKLGCEVIAIVNDDDENVFNISLSTFPKNSRGTAHILEHIVLCGSEHFPVKDPFFAMGRRSMNTFMNALTGTDFTCYPAASQIPQDFYNLFKVYLDAVFRPRLLIESFWQEGMHLGMSDDDSLIIKGIVYNEMKGAMSNPDSRLHEKLSEMLFPDLPYRFNSGGNPTKIREISYEEIKAFHEQYYHPSRALYYFYGNLDLKKHLDFLEEHALQGLSPLPSLPKLSKQPRLQQKKISTIHYPLLANEEKKDKTLLGIGYLTTSILEQEELLALHVIDLALMGTDAAPLKSAILKSNLCKQVDSSIDDEISEVPYLFICKGCSEQSASEIGPFIHKTLETLAKEGIENHLIEGALHQLEFSRTEITGHSWPYGLSLFFRAGLLKQHGGNPSDGLQVHTLFRKLREKFADPTYISYLLNKHLLNNTHCVELRMHPQSDLAAIETQEEKEYVESIVKNLSDKEKKEIKKRDKHLLKYQDDEGDLEVLPRLTLKEVPHEGKDFPLEKESFASLSLYHHRCFTNNIFYAALFFDLSQIKEVDLPFLHLFTILAPELGCGGRNYKDHLDYVFQYTGGIELDLDLFVSCQNPGEMRPALSLRGKSLHTNSDKLLALYNDLLSQIDFSDTDRIRELLKQHKESLENSIEKHPLRYAMNMAASGISKPLHFHYLWQGFSYFEKAKEIIADFMVNPMPFVQKMRAFQEKMLAFSKGDLVMSLSEDMYFQIKAKELYGLKSPKDSPQPIWTPEKDSPLAISSQGRIISAPVAFTALSFGTVPFTDPRSSALSVAAEIMENKTLHKKIREQGGAYGGGASHSASWGYFHFHGYRDPNLKTTLDAFQEAVTELASGKFDERDLEEAKLCILQVHDTPTSPENRAIVAYNWLRCGRTKEVRQAYRDRLLSLTKQEIQRVAEEILLPGLTNGTLITFAGKELLTRENLLLKEKALPLFSV